MVGSRMERSRCPASELILASSTVPPASLAGGTALSRLIGSEEWSTPVAFEPVKRAIAAARLRSRDCHRDLLLRTR